MAKLLVKRKGYTRKGGTRVKATTYKTKDMGAKGRTPKSKRWSPKKWTHTGWSKDLPMRTRRSLALKGHDNNYLSTAQGLQRLSNLTADPTTKRLAKSDADYFYKMHEKTGK